MSTDINRTVQSGRLTRDAELKYINNGTALVSFSMAVNRSKKVGDQWEEEVSFFDYTMWGRRGEAVHKYLTKGKQIIVESEPRQDRWEKDGQSRTKVKFNVTNLVLARGRGGEQQTQASPTQQPNQQPQQESLASEFEDDVPFNLGPFVIFSHRGAYEDMQRMWPEIAGGSVLPAFGYEGWAA